MWVSVISYRKRSKRAFRTPGRLPCATMASMQNFWSSSGFSRLQRDDRGWLPPTPDYLRLFLARPELAPVPESCRAEVALHAALLESPSNPVAPEEVLKKLAALEKRARFE